MLHCFSVIDRGAQINIGLEPERAESVGLPDLALHLNSGILAFRSVHGALSTICTLPCTVLAHTSAGNGKGASIHRCCLRVVVRHDLVDQICRVVRRPAHEYLFLSRQYVLRLAHGVGVGVVF